MVHLLWVLGSPGVGKTTLCRSLVRIYPQSLLIDADLHDNNEPLRGYIDSGKHPSLADLLNKVPRTLDQVEWQLQEAIMPWRSDHNIQLLVSGLLTDQKLGPLWQTGLLRLFEQFSMVIIDDWQPEWLWCLPHADILILGPSTDWADDKPFNWQKANATYWLRVAVPTTMPTTPRSINAFQWNRIGHIPWVSHPVSKNPVYQQALQDALLRLR